MVNKHRLNHWNVSFSLYVCFQKLLSHSAALIGWGVWYGIPHGSLLVFAWLSDSRGEEPQHLRETGGGLEDSVWYVSPLTASVSVCLRPVLLSGRFFRTKRAEGRGGRGERSMLLRAKGRRVREGVRRSRGLALGLFAALSVPLPALAHLHLRQLDVAQHVGVCGGEKNRKPLIFCITCMSVIRFSPIRQYKTYASPYIIKGCNYFNVFF